MQAQSSPKEMAARIQSAINQHDLEAFVACFDPDYHSEEPAHPDRAFDGQDQVRKNWSQVFSSVPDIEATLLMCTAEGETVWADWHWRGTHADGTPFAICGVTLFEVQEDRITWGRWYMEPVQEGGSGIDASVQQTYGARSQPES
jgi:ketosteroid isomerase-like protein